MKEKWNRVMLIQLVLFWDCLSFNGNFFTYKEVSADKNLLIAFFLNAVDCEINTYSWQCNADFNQSEIVGFSHLVKKNNLTFVFYDYLTKTICVPRFHALKSRSRGNMRIKNVFLKDWAMECKNIFWNPAIVGSSRD